ncbi:MAG: orotate phosphoribosyltransferase [Clostridiales Family XIII bacterium]|nr:orotate phosphoribosyltransferase [Clostridiales Family XIII bacterium]
MTGYKTDFIHFLAEAGALKFGDFTLKSGRRSPYFINTGAFDSGEKIARLGDYYAACIMEHIGSGTLPADIRTVYGPAYKGIPLAVATASSLARVHGRDVGFAFNRKEAKDHGEGGSFVGAKLADGDRILLVDDVITAGTAIRETIPLLRAAADVEIVGLILSVDRMERGTAGAAGALSAMSAVMEAERALGLRVLPIVNVRELFAGAAALTDEKGAPLLTEDLRARMDKYMEAWCV